ncbi:MAG: hypothetical protein JXA13_11235 [Anaerolineales bacterium]|nr:hypothetical protein [Anaerolineales bacterium]
MKNTNWIWRTIAAVVVIVLLAGSGIALYRLGYAHGLRAAQPEDGFPRHMFMQQEFDNNWDQGGRIIRNWDMPMWPERGVAQFPPRVMPGYFPGLGLFAAFFKLAFLVLIIWLIYKFITALLAGQGWQLTFQKLPIEKKSNSKKKK